MQTPSPLITGAFDTPEAADRAIQRLLALDYRSDEIGLAMSSDARDQWFPAKAASHPDRRIPRGIVGGAVVGGALGAIVAGLTLVAIPGALAMPFVAGWLAVALTDTALGAAGGSVIGTLVSAGIPEETARGFEEAIHADRIVVAVRAHDGEVTRVREILQSPATITSRGDAELDKYDEEVAESFPASDPPSSTQP